MKNLRIKLISSAALFVFGLSLGLLLSVPSRPALEADNLRLDEQEATVRAIKKVSPAVVNIDVYQNVKTPLILLGSGTSTTESRKEKVGSGTGFLISSDGLLLTNKHVIEVQDASKAEYKVIMQNGKQYYAQLIGKDPLNDLAILKIFDKNLPFVELGDSDKLAPGISVIAIGNALGVYQNSVTKGIVSGLNRDIIASDQAGSPENLGNVIQTDAEINFGNSGGPLIDLEGKLVGINVAVDASGSSIGFAIAVNDAKPVIKSAREVGRIVRPRLGVRYVMITPDIAREKKLTLSNGALVDNGGSGQPAVATGSPAEKGGIKAGDIIIEANGTKIEGRNTLLSVTQKFKPGNVLNLKIWRNGKTIKAAVTLDEFKL
ncbi:PDZ domain-containing protein [Candidatus Falkowbacteria bacterium]|nr:PDZ domain-containing protein [Candidatus Falkowbacteria bacterium]